MMKYILISLLSLLPFVTNSQIELVGNITTFGGGSYPTHLDSLGKGGLTVVANATERNTITQLRRKVGMVVFQVDESQLYYLDAPITENNWVPIETGVTTIDTTQTTIYCPAHGIDLTDYEGEFLPMFACRGAQADHIDSLQTYYAVDIPDPDSITIIASGLIYRPNHDLADYIGKIVYLTNTVGAYDTIQGTVLSAIAVVIDSNYIDLLPRSVLESENGLFVLPLPASFLNSYLGDAKVPQDTAVQRIARLYASVGLLRAGGKVITQSPAISDNPIYTSTGANPVNPGMSWTWTGGVNGRVIKDKELIVAIDLEDDTYGGLNITPLDTVVLVGGVPTDTTVFNWLEDNVTNRNLRLPNGSLLYFVGNGSRQNPDYIWSVIDDISGNVSGSTRWSRLIKRIKTPASGGSESTTASNGLTLSGVDVKLGGTLTGATTITGAGYNLTETGLGYYNFEADSAIWRINGEKFMHMGRIRGNTGDDYGELAIGYRAGANLPTWGAKANTLVGSFAGENLNGTVSVGGANAFFGHKAGQLVQTGSYNTFIGVAAGANTGTGVSISTGVGHHALINATTGNHIAIGQSTLQNTSGSVGIAIGNQALTSNTTASYNIGIGTEALQSTTTGGESTVIGHAGFKTNISGSKNVGLGYFAGRLTTGSNNIFLGWSAGETITTGSGNIILAHGGALSSITASNELNIGHAIYGSGLNGATKVGLFGINEATPARTLHVTLNNSNTTTAGIGLRLAGQTSATAGTGFGFLQETALETSAGTNAIASTIGTIYTDATTGSEDADYIINLMDAGATAAEKFRVDSDGNIRPSAGYKDTSGDLGTAGQQLSSTGTGTNWVSDTTSVMVNDSIIGYYVAGVEVGRDTIRTSGSGGGGGGTWGSITGTLSAQTDLQSALDAKEEDLTFSTGLTRSVNTITSNLSTGVSGGQTAIGGTASGNNLTLSSTSNATKGKILFGTSGYDEVNNRFGLGTTTPNQQLELTGNMRLPAMTFASQNGVIYKDGNRWLHDFRYGNNGTVFTDGNNIFLGENAGNFTMGATAIATDQSSYNIGIGKQVLVSNTRGKENIGVGVFSLFSNTTGDLNSAIGVSALELNTTGSYNMAVGRSALSSNTTGTDNTAIGFVALRGNTTGSNNIGIGSNAGRYIANGSTANSTSGTSIYIGGLTKALANGGANEIVIGYDATGLGSNTAVLGNSSITTTALRGDIGIGTTTPGLRLDVRSTSAHTTAVSSIANSTVTTPLKVFATTATPESVITGSPGDIARSNAGVEYLKETGSATNTGWKKKLTTTDITVPSQEIVYGTGTGITSNVGFKYTPTTGARMLTTNGMLDVNTTNEEQVSPLTSKFDQDFFVDIDPDFEPGADSMLIPLVRLRHRGTTRTGTRRPYIVNEGQPGAASGGDFVYQVHYEGMKLWRYNNTVHNNSWGIAQPPNSRLDIGWTTGVPFAKFYRTTDNIDTTSWFTFKSTGELFAHAYRNGGESEKNSFTGLVTLDNLGNYQRTNFSTLRDSLPVVVNLSLTGTNQVIELTNSAGADVVIKGVDIGLTKVTGTKDTLYLTKIEHWGEVSINGGSTSVTSGTPERPDNDTPGTPTASLSSEFTQSSSTVTYIGAAGQGEIKGTISFSPSATGDYLVSLYQEGAEVSVTEIRLTATASEYTTVSVPTASVNMATNDTFELRIEPVSSSSTITVHKYNVYVSKIY